MNLELVFGRDDESEDTCCAICGVLLDRPKETDSPVYAWFEIMAFRFVHSKLETLSRKEVGFPRRIRMDPPRCVHNSLDECPIIAVHVKCFELLQRFVRVREQEQQQQEQQQEEQQQEETAVAPPRSLEDF
ncbi:hypothetical protein BJX70DRAFT_371652 [Aspergillus crustosus]